MVESTKLKPPSAVIVSASSSLASPSSLSAATVTTFAPALPDLCANLEDPAQMELALDAILAGDQPSLMTDPSSKPLTVMDDTLKAFILSKMEKRKRQPQQQSQADKIIAYLSEA